MKKFFIFLFSVFLITFMGCSPATGEIPETPTSETTEETIEDATEEIEEAGGEEATEEIPEETFEVFALDDDGNIIAGIDEINAKFNRPATNSPGSVQPLFYKNIKINNKIYTVKGLEANNTRTISYNGDSIHILFLKAYNVYYFDRAANSLSFVDFYNNACIHFNGDVIEISFSDLYEEVVQ